MEDQNLNSLLAQKMEIEKQIESIKLKNRKKTLAEIINKIREYGFSHQELFNENGDVNAAPDLRGIHVRSRKPAPILYRDDEGNAWSGRGKQPRWLRKHIESGRQISEFLVQQE